MQKVFQVSMKCHGVLLLLCVLVFEKKGGVASRNINSCEKYRGHICDRRDYDDSDQPMLVHNGGKTTQEQKEKELENLLGSLTNHAYSSCQNFIKYILCRQFFSICKRENDRPSYVMSICRNDCVLAKSSLCLTHMKNAPAELTDRLIHENCSSLQETKCIALNVPSNRMTIEDSCLLDHYKKDTYMVKLDALQNNKLNVIPYLFTSSRTDTKEDIDKQYLRTIDKKPTCIQKERMISSIRRNFRSTTALLQLPNLETNNLDSRIVHGYCFTYNKDKTTYEKLNAPLGILPRYTPDKFLRLHNVLISFVKTQNTVFIRAKGTYNLCGVSFNYTIKPENSDITVLQGDALQSMPMSLIEMSHPFKRFSDDIENVLNQNFKLIQTLTIHEPTWSIIWSHGERVTAFKGHSSIALGKDIIKDVHTEFIIGQESSFRVLRMSMKLKLFQLLNIFLSSSQIFSLPLIGNKWEHSLKMEKVDFTFATDHVKIPSSKYLRSHFKLARYFMEGNIEKGMSITATGRTPNTKSKDVLLSLIEGNKQFDLSLTIGANKITTLEIKFDEKEDFADCANKKRNRKNWGILIKRIRTLQRLADNRDSKTTIRKRKCDGCCGASFKSLLSIKIKIYRETYANPFALLGFGPSFKNFVDIDVFVAENENMYHYQLKKLNTT